MKTTYRTIKDNQKLSGRGRITWEYFETFENIFFDDKTILDQHCHLCNVHLSQ